MIRKYLALLLLLPSLAMAERQWLDASFEPVEESEASFYMEQAPQQQGDGWPVKVYYREGGLRLEGVLDGPDLVDDGLVGPYRFYHANGALQEQASRDDQNRYHGELLSYHDNGQLRFRQNYRHGTLHGEFSEYHDNGQLESRTELVDGKRRDGECLHYDAQGRLAARHFYQDDKLEGPAERYREGVLLSREHYRSGVLEGLKQSFHADGSKSSEHSLKNDRIEGLERRWHANGKLFLESSYRQGKQHGAFRRFDEAGVLVEEAEYRNGIKVGVNRDYFPSGALRKEETLDDKGQRQRQEQFDEQGNRLSLELRESGTHGVHLRSETYRLDGSLESRLQKTLDGRWELREAFAEDGSQIERYEERQGRSHGLRLSVGWQGERREEHFREGRREGLFKVTSRTGEVIEQGRYRADNKVGEWLQVDALVRRTENYDQQGRLHGEQRSETVAGELLQRGHYRNGLRHGRAEYYEAGKLVEAGEYRDDKPDGVWRQRLYDGLNWHGSYRKGLQVGIWRALSAEGYLMASARYDDQGRPTGTHYSFEVDGGLARVDRYRDGRQHGLSEYFAGGRRFMVMEYDEGILLETRRDED
ncbi:toxin-antitoxin system YwqK family antitoxin [Pseudomonas mangrovi]|nr:toxin-antitoxin system YwqK family antitoxin [Pseudomonas mangrovi]